MGRTFRVATTSVIAALALATVAAGCEGPHVTAPPAAVDPGVDPASRALLDAHGLRPNGPTTVTLTTIGDRDTQPWSQYLDVSKAAGLDFSALQGLGAELRVTPVEGWADDAASFVLVRSGGVIGAWIGPGGTSSGVLPITTRP